MSELTLEKIGIFLKTNASTISNNNCNDSQIGADIKITDIDIFLMNKIAILDASPTRKDNFLTLYNDQYIRNLEMVVGICCISAVLAKMMFYPIII